MSWRIEHYNISKPAITLNCNSLVWLILPFIGSLSRRWSTRKNDILGQDLRYGELFIQFYNSQFIADESRIKYRFFKSLLYYIYGNIINSVVHNSNCFLFLNHYYRTRYKNYIVILLERFIKYFLFLENFINFPFPLINCTNFYLTSTK